MLRTANKDNTDTEYQIIGAQARSSNVDVASLVFGNYDDDTKLTYRLGEICVRDNYGDSISNGFGNLYFRTNGTSTTSSNLSTQMTILHNGNVGIGNINPSFKLDVNGAIRAITYCNIISQPFYSSLSNPAFTASNVIFNTSNNIYPILSATSNNAFLWTKTGTNIYYANGNVGIGTTSTNAKLHVAGNILTSSGTMGLPALGVVGGNGDKLILWTGTTTMYPYSFGINTNTLWYSVPNGATHKWYINGVVGMTLSNNLIGINVQNPIEKLHVNGNIYAQGKIYCTDISSVNGSRPSQGLYVWGDSNFGMELQNQNGTWNTTLVTRINDGGISFKRSDNIQLLYVNNTGNITSKNFGRLTKTDTTGGSVSITISWPVAYGNGQFFIFIETIQQVGEGGSTHDIKIQRHSIRTFSGAVSLYASSIHEDIGNVNIPFSINTTFTSNSITLTSSHNWNYLNNPAKNHTFTVNILQVPDQSMFNFITLS